MMSHSSSSFFIIRPDILIATSGDWLLLQQVQPQAAPSAYGHFLWANQKDSDRCFYAYACRYQVLSSSPKYGQLPELDSELDSEDGMASRHQVV